MRTWPNIQIKRPVDVVMYANSKFLRLPLHDVKKQEAGNPNKIGLQGEELKQFVSDSG